VKHVRVVVESACVEGTKKREKKEKKKEKKRCDLREAFAMMGALAWQSTVINKIFLCPGEEIARGLICFGPGFSSPLVSLSPLLCVPPLLLCATELVHHLSRRHCKKSGAPAILKVQSVILVCMQFPSFFVLRNALILSSRELASR